MVCTQLKIMIMVLTLSMSIFSSAQVGINTEEPQATLHAEPSSSSSPTGEDGILLPRVSQFPTVNPERKGQLILLKNNALNPDGFYYWDGENWIPFQGDSTSEIDETIYSFDGTGYTGTTLTRELNLSKFIKKEEDGFTLADNAVTVGKSGLYLVSLTANVKKPGGAESQANFTYSVLVNDLEASSAKTSITAEAITSASATFSFLKRLNEGDKINVTITKTSEGPNNYEAFGTNNLTLYFIQN